MDDSRAISPREAARAYGRAGIAVLPLHCIKKDGRCSCGKDCKTPGKHPWTKNGADDATTDDRRICEWWDETPGANVGIAPDIRKGWSWIVLDLDVGRRLRKNVWVDLDGEADLRALEDEWGVDIDRTTEQESGSGARHVILRIPTGTRTPGKLSKAIDVIGPGKYIVAAPSNHLSGHNYRWLDDPGPGYERIGELFDRAAIAPKQLAEFDAERRGAPARRRDADRQDGGSELRALAKKTDLSGKEFAAAVMSIPNSGQGVDYDQYLNVMFAVHFETDGSDAGLDLMHEWAEQCDLYEADDVDRRWKSIRNEKVFSKTGKYIIMKALDHGWEPTENLLDWQKAIRRINQTHAYVPFGSDARILKEIKNGSRIEAVEYLKLSTFTTNFLPEKYDYPSPTEKDPDRLKPKDIGTIWINNDKRRDYDRVTFEPDLARARKGDYNLYRGLTIAPAALARPRDGCSMLVDHIYDVIAGGNDEYGDWIIAWLAQIVQQPWRKPGTALVLVGREGVGKSILGDVMKVLLGAHHVIASDSQHILSNFNASLATAIFVQLEEAFWAGDKRAQGALFHLITGRTIRLEPKGVDPIEINSYARVMITTNADWAVPAGLEARRFGVFRVLDTVRQNRPHFRRLVAQMEGGGYAAFLQHLMQVDLSKFDVGVAPKTEALLDQKLESLNYEQSFVVDILGDDSDISFEIWPDDKPAEIAAGELLRLAEQFYASRKFRWPGSALFIEKLKKLLPVRLYRPHGGKRRYRLPTIGEARGHFNGALGQTLFPE